MLTAWMPSQPVLANKNFTAATSLCNPPRLACAPFGGPVAAIRDERRMVVITSGNMRPVIRTFTAAGEQLGAMVWERGSILEWGWSDDLELIIVEASGRVRPR